ncbi:MAG: T9SS type A sorting domain-containing protein, partial [Flavobacteriales bacterium]
TSSCTFFVDIVEMVATVEGTSASCQGGTNGTATVSVTGGTAPYTEDWGGFDPTSLEAGTYAVTVSDANGCSTTASVTIEDGELFEIEIDPAADVVICDGGSVSLDAGSGYAAYNWSTGATVQSITVSNEASYWVTVTNADGCLSNTDTVDVMFFNDPIPMVVSTTDGIISCSNDTASTYQWYLNNAPIDGATNSYYCPRGSGNYYVVITDSHGCTVTSAISEYTYDENSPCATGIEELGLTLDVFPNPSTGIFTVNYVLETQQDMKLTIFDLLGQQVTDNVLISSQNGTTVIDMSIEADGIYTLRIELEGDKVLQQRLVLVK